MIATELKLEVFVYIVVYKSTIKENRICFNNNNSLSLAVGLAVVAVETKKAYYQIKKKIRPPMYILNSRLGLECNITYFRSQVLA